MNNNVWMGVINSIITTIISDLHFLYQLWKFNLYRAPVAVFRSTHGTAKDFYVFEDVSIVDKKVHAKTVEVVRYVSIRE